jgi:hypothetical protein
VEELLAGCGGTRWQDLAVGVSMVDDDVVRMQGRPAAAFIAWASRLGFKPLRRRRYPSINALVRRPDIDGRAWQRRSRTDRSV